MTRECGSVDIKPILQELRAIRKEQNEQRQAIKLIGNYIFKNGLPEQGGYQETALPAVGAGLAAFFSSAAFKTIMAAIIGEVVGRLINDLLNKLEEMLGLRRPGSGNGDIDKIIRDIKRDTAIIGSRTQNIEQRIGIIAKLEKKVNDSLFILQRIRPEITTVGRKVNDMLFAINRIRPEISTILRKSNDAAFAATQASIRANQLQSGIAQILAEIKNLRPNFGENLVKQIVAALTASILSGQLRQYLDAQFEQTRLQIKSEALFFEARLNTLQSKVIGDINRWTTDQLMDVHKNINQFRASITKFLNDIYQTIWVQGKQLDRMEQGIVKGFTVVQTTVVSGFTAMGGLITANAKATIASIATTTAALTALITKSQVAVLAAEAASTAKILAAIAALGAGQFLKDLLAQLINTMFEKLLQELLDRLKKPLEDANAPIRETKEEIKRIPGMGRTLERVKEQTDEQDKLIKKILAILGGNNWSSDKDGNVSWQINPEAAVRAYGNAVYADGKVNRMAVGSLPDLMAMLQVPQFFRSGLNRLPAKVPETIHVKREKGKEPQVKEIQISSLLDFQNWQFKQLDSALGAYPIQIKYKDEEGEEKELVIENIAEMLAEQMGIILSLASESDIQTELLLKTIAETIKGSNSTLYVSDHVQAISEFLGYKGREIEKNVPMQVTPNAKTLKDLMKPSSQKIAGWELTDSDDLMVHIKKLLFFGSIIHSVFYKTVDNIPGDLIKTDLNDKSDVDENNQPKADKQEWDAFINSLRNPPTFLRDPGVPAPKVKDYSNIELDGNPED